MRRRRKPDREPIGPTLREQDIALAVAASELEVALKRAMLLFSKSEGLSEQK